jgi:hypothetical protein
MAVQLPLPAPSSFPLSHFLLVTYVRLECANAPQSDRVPISGTNLGTVRIPFTLNDLEDYDTFMASRRCVQLLLFTLDYGVRSRYSVRSSRRNDEALLRIMKMVETPDRMAENLVRFIRSKG